MARNDAGNLECDGAIRWWDTVGVGGSKQNKNASKNHTSLRHTPLLDACLSRYSLVTRLQLLVVPDGEQARIVLNHVVHVALKLTKGKGLPHLHHHAHLRVKVHLLDEVVGSLLKQSLEDDHEAASGVLQ